MSNADDRELEAIASNPQFDISDCTFDLKKRGPQELALVIKTESSFNAMKIYLCLCYYKECLEQELGIHHEDGEIY